MRTWPWSADCTKRKSPLPAVPVTSNGSARPVMSFGKMTTASKTAGLTLGNMMIGGFPQTIYGKPGRDEEIEKVRQSIRAAGRAGLPVVEYNFYAHRIVEGYYEETGRAGAGLTAFDYAKVNDPPP